MVQLKAYKDLSFRILLISISSVVLLYLTQNSSHDPHLMIRKKQSTSDQVLIIETPDESKIQNLIRQLQSFTPKAIILPHSKLLTFDPANNIYVTSPSTNKNLDQTITINLQLDSDGNVRRFSVLKTKISKELFKDLNFGAQYLINFRGPQDTFQIVSDQDISHEMGSLFKNKILVFKIQRIEKKLVTPLGVMGRSEVIANIFDNYFENRFIHKISMAEQFFVCFFILIISLVVLIFLPTSLALASSVLLIILYVSASLTLFDKFYFWTPVLTPILQIFITYILISNYKLILNEQTRWRLEKESNFLSEVEEMKTNFLSLFSHDLKTPLAKILASVETQLSQSNINEQQKGELLKIKAYCGDIERYFKRILKTAQVESKKIALNKTPTDLNKLIEKVVNKFKPTATDKRIQFDLQLPPLFLIEIDETLIQEVIFNFVENALSHSPEGSLVTIKSDEEKQFIKISVIDQGPGIPLELQDRVWEKFYRLESKDQGYGLGLYLSKYVVELHGGQVYLKTKKDKGSEFGFLLPIDEVSS